MILNLKALFAGGERIDFDYPLDMSDFEAMQGDFPFREPVRVSGSVINHAGSVSLNAKAEGNYHTRCDRCLKEIVEHLTVPFEYLLTVELAGDEEDDQIIVCENETLDIDDLAQTNVILSLSTKHLCREDCKGLCPFCGKDLNDGDCGCGGERTGSAFSQLRNLLH